MALPLRARSPCYKGASCEVFYRATVRKRLLHACVLSNGAMSVRRGVPAADLRRLIVTRIVPFGFGLGAFMEAFMYYTGFWSVATKKEAERRAERATQLVEALPPAWVARPPAAGPAAAAAPPLK